MPPTHEAAIAEQFIRERLQAVGEGAPSPEEKCAMLEHLRSISPGAAREVERMLLGDADSLRSALHEAQGAMHELKAMLDKLLQPPWFTGVFLHPVEDDFDLLDEFEGQRVMVYQGGGRRVVALAEGLDVMDFEFGDEVYLNHEGTAVLGKSPLGAPRVGETAMFDRYTDDHRLVLRWRDEEILVEAAAALRAITLETGDLVRADRSTWIAYEKIARPAARRYFFDEVPDVRTSQVGGQRANLSALLDALTTVLVSPEKARRYRLDGRQSILLDGPPGCGKTLMARVAAAELKRISGKSCRFAVVKPGEWEDPYVGVTQQNIRGCFKALREAACDAYAVLFLDEIECAGRIRGSAVGHHSDKFLAALLAELDGFAGREGVAIICATNRKDLVDPSLLERISDIEIVVNRPDMRGAEEIFGIHLDESIPFSPNGEAGGRTREQLVRQAVSRLYAPNGDNELCVIRFRDGRSRTVTARELMSGRVIEQICRATRQAACRRDVTTDQAGVRIEDVDEAVSHAIGRLATTLTPRNAHAYLTDLPQDVDVVAVEPIARRVTRSHRYMNVQ